MAKTQGVYKTMQKELKKLKTHLKICKIIILLLLFVLMLPKFATMEEKNIKILKSNEKLEKELIIEAKKIHDFNKIGLNYVYDFEI